MLGGIFNGINSAVYGSLDFVRDNLGEPVPEVGECFLWHWLTRVVPDKIQKAVKRLCV